MPTIKDVREWIRGHMAGRAARKAANAALDHQLARDAQLRRQDGAGRRAAKRSWKAQGLDVFGSVARRERQAAKDAKETAAPVLSGFTPAKGVYLKLRKWVGQ